MLAAVRSAAVLGVDAFEVTVEVDVTDSLACWSVVGTEALRTPRRRKGQARLGRYR